MASLLICTMPERSAPVSFSTTAAIIAGRSLIIAMIASILDVPFRRLYYSPAEGIGQPTNIGICTASRIDRQLKN